MSFWVATRHALFVVRFPVGVAVVAAALPNRDGHGDACDEITTEGPRFTATRTPTDGYAYRATAAPPQGEGSSLAWFVSVAAIALLLAVAVLLLLARRPKRP